jgi:hypothetical protein
MPQVSHQTIRLAKGKHQSAGQGACVMELASMLAGEPFTDHPRSVSAPIASFLRRYNDLLDDRRRQDLYPYASRVVGTASSPQVELGRVQRLMAWADEMWASRRWPLRCRLTALRRGRARAQHPELAGSYAVRALPRMSDSTHAAALALIDELIAMQSDDPLELEPVVLREEPAAIPVGAAR